MARSLRVSPQYIQKAKLSLKRNGYPSQSAFAEDVGISLSTVKNFISGKPVDYQYFVDICEKLGLDWKDISQIDSQDGENVKPERNNFPIPCTAYKEETWVGREEEIRELSEKLRKECRILIITGITGQGKTALAERLASVELGGEWQRLPAVNFDDGVSSDFVGAADVLLTRLGETVTPQERSQPEFLLNRLVQKLRTNRYLVQIDSLEVLLKKGDKNPVRNEFEDARWWEFFQQLLAGGECQSRLILTSQHLPTQFSSRYKKFWHEKALSGLSEAEQLFSKLFEEQGKEILPRSEAAGYLLRMGNTYEGHPLLIEVLAGEILEHPYNGNVVAYWRKHQQEFAVIAPAKNSEELERNVKDRVRETLKRLEKDIPYAYTLLLRSSVYRLPVTEDFWLAMLQGLTDKAKNSALEILKNRYLVEESVTTYGKHLLRQHNLIRNVTYQQLSEISNKDSEWQSYHYIAAQMWRTAYQPEPDASNLEKIQGYIEAFHHYCEVGDWKSAGIILAIRLNTTTNEQLHRQLGSWGYYREQIELYSKLLGKLEPRFDAPICNGLGSAYSSQGDYFRAIYYFQQHLVMSKNLGNNTSVGEALGNLGVAYDSLGYYNCAIFYYHRSLEIAQKNGNRAGEGTALGNLGITYKSKGDFYNAIVCYKQYVEIAKEINDLYATANALCNVGSLLIDLKNYLEAQKPLLVSLKISRVIGKRFQEAYALGNLAKLYQKLEQCNLALEYCEQALALATELGIPLAKDCQKLKEELLKKN